jgi:hypothetical protein
VVSLVVVLPSTVDGVLAYKKQNEYQLSQPYSNVKNIQITKTTETFYCFGIAIFSCIGGFTN